MPGFVAILLVGLALLWVLVVAWTAWLLTHPPRRTYSAAVARGIPGDPGELTPARPFSTWTFRDPRGRDLPVWDVQGDQPTGPVIVLTHGWGDSRIGGLVRIAALAPFASRLILWDLPGHGEAPGMFSLGPLELDALETLIRTLREQGADVDVLYGWSFGAVASLELAARDPRIRTVIAESPYRFRATPPRNVLRARGLPHRLTLDPARALASVLSGAWSRRDRAYRSFDGADVATRLHANLLVIHGSQDAISPPAHGEVIAGSAGGELAAIAGAGHNDLWTNPAFAAQASAAIARHLR